MADIRLRFINDDEIRTLNAEHAAKHRRCLFTDTEREQMSNDLINSIGSQNHDPGQALLGLEQDCRDANERAFSAIRGPFGVSRWESVHDEMHDETGNVRNSYPYVDIDIPEPDEELSSWLLEAAQTASVTDDFALGLLQTPSPTSQMKTNTKDTLIDILDLELPPVISPLPLPTAAKPGDQDWSLLSYYRNRIISLISPQKQVTNDNDTWSRLILPCAMRTMAELTIGGEPSYARLSLLNTLLATSAFHLDASSSASTPAPTEDWTGIGEGYVACAKRFLNDCLDESNGPFARKNKYKEVLMAMLSLADAFMVKSDPDNRLTYLLQAERFIRTRGFEKPALSRKRRTLHHCYAYMRIMAETTRPSITLGTEPDISEYTGGDKFCVSHWTSLSDNMILREKDPDTARRDLHLEVPGQWTSTLFPELYGITEGFLLLLSQVIRLANERDLTIDHHGADGLGLKEFTLRAKALEKNIYRLISSSEMETGSGTATAQAMYTALLIFFYRRVHNLDAVLLQSNVLTVQNLLKQEGHKQRAVTLVWAAFVAACEALLPESQGFFAEWFEGMGRRTGLVSIALGVFEFVWARREVQEGEVSWPDVLRLCGVKVLCT